MDVSNLSLRDRVLNYFGNIFEQSVNLKQGALMRDDETYVVTGRHSGRSYTDPLLMVGNPVDIVGTLIQSVDFYSSDMGSRLNDSLFSNRNLIHIDDYAKENYDPLLKPGLCSTIPLTYRGGLLVPNQDPIGLTKPETYSPLSCLKDSQGFLDAALEFFGSERSEDAHEIKDHLFHPVGLLR